MLKPWMNTNKKLWNCENTKLMINHKPWPICFIIETKGHMIFPSEMTGLRTHFEDPCSKMKHECDDETEKYKDLVWWLNKTVCWLIFKLYDWLTPGLQSFESNFSGRSTVLGPMMPVEQVAQTNLNLFKEPMGTMYCNCLYNIFTNNKQVHVWTKSSLHRSCCIFQMQVVKKWLCLLPLKQKVRTE